MSELQIVLTILGIWIALAAGFFAGAAWVGLFAARSEDGQEEAERNF